MKTTDSAAAGFLHREHHRARKTLLIWSAAAVLAAAAMIGAHRLGWFARGERWALAPAVLSAVLLGWWFRRASQLTRTAYARELDARWALRSRLETAVELSHDDSALAAAQRTEARQQLAGREHAGLAAWLTGLAAIVLILASLGVEGTALVIRSLRAKPPAAVAAAAAKAKPPVPPEALAAIEWKTPAREIKATAIEEVPLTAVADSTKGFRAVTLEVFVNGESNLSRTLDPAALGESAQPGAHELKPSLYLDETGAKPYDIVSYHLTGELHGSAPGRVVTSPLQFIQIRPAQTDVEQKGKINPDSAHMLSLLSSLKLAQLRLIEANFTLSRLADSKDDPSWQKENSSVATDQKNLAAKTDEARDFALSKNAPPLIAKNLGEARSLMINAAKSIDARANEDAAKPQGRALALITECEKLFGRLLNVDGPLPPPMPMDDPFHDAQIFKLQPRSETPAGQLEKLAERQREANRQLNSSTGGQPTGGGSGGRAENEIARDAEALARSGQLDSAAQQSTHDAAGAAAGAARQLAADDIQAAREPAGIALAALEKAVEAQERAGREIAIAGLDRARRVLNAASRNPNAGERGSQLVTVHHELQSAAAQQQRNGSAEAARQLATLAELMSAAKIPGTLSKPNSAERAREAASAAARSQVALSVRATALNRAIRQLTRATPPANGTGLPPEAYADVEIASQEAEWLTSDTPTIELARHVSVQTSAVQSPAGTPDKAKVRELADGAAQLAKALETARSIGKRDEVVRRFNVEEIDPAYREAVETYFERLSREGAKAVPAAPARP